MAWRSFVFMVAAFLLIAFVGFPAVRGQQTVQTVYVGNKLTNGTSLSASVPATSTTVNLTAQSSQVTIKLVSGGATALYFNPFGGDATSSNYTIEPGETFTYQANPPISTFTILGSSASGTYSVLAH
jgi:hypothetical protein